MLELSYPGIFKGYSCHNHTDWSDGANSLEDMCRAGKAAGLQVMGISDHWVEAPYPGMDSEEWAMDLNKLDDYVAALQKMKQELDDENFTLKIGLEVDFFFENIDSVLARLKNYPLDYLIGSVHYAGTFPVDHIIDEWLPLSEAEKEEICGIYWQKLAGAAAVKEFDFIGHLDLPKKFGMIDNRKYLPQAFEVLEIIHQNGGAIELNTAGYFKECAEAYPALEILRRANELRIPVIISADAHAHSHIRRNFTEAAEMLKTAGYPIL